MASLRKRRPLGQQGTQGLAAMATTVFFCACQFCGALAQGREKKNRIVAEAIAATWLAQQTTWPESSNDEFPAVWADGGHAADKAACAIFLGGHDVQQFTHVAGIATFPG